MNPSPPPPRYAWSPLRVRGKALRLPPPRIGYRIHTSPFEAETVKPARSRPPCGGGPGWGVARTGKLSATAPRQGDRHGATPHPNPPPQKGAGTHRDRTLNQNV